MYSINKQTQIFFTHSSKDTEIVNIIQHNFKNNFNNEIFPFFSKSLLSGRDPKTKIMDAIEHSKALFMILTSNLVNNQKTRDYAVFELGIAVCRKLPIYAWKSVDIQEEQIPIPVKWITDYTPFDPSNQENLLATVETMLILAKKISDQISDLQHVKDIEETIKKKCDKCGANLKDDDVFCPKCGTMEWHEKIYREAGLKK